jgi:hypothetical protein
MHAPGRGHVSRNLEGRRLEELSLRRIRTLPVLGLLTLALVCVLAAATYGAVNPAVGTRVTDVVRKSTQNTPLRRAAGTNRVILSVALPAASWVVSADVSAVNFGPSDYVRCGIYRNANGLNGSTATVGDPNAPGARAPAPFVATINTTAAIRSSSAFTASLRCQHDFDTPQGHGAPYIDADAVLWAHKAASRDFATQS